MYRRKLLVYRMRTGYLLWSQVDYWSLSSLEPNRKVQLITNMMTNFDNTIWQNRNVWLTITKIQYDIYTMYNINKGQDFKPWTWKRTKLLSGICLVIQRVKLRNNLLFFIYYQVIRFVFYFCFLISHKTKFDILSKLRAYNVAIPHWSEMCWLRKRHFAFGFNILLMVLVLTVGCYTIQYFFYFLFLFSLYLMSPAHQGP